MTQPARIAVLGAGMMGHGIAQVFAVAGHQVAVYDPDPTSLDTLRSRVRDNLRDLGQDETAAEQIHPCPDLADAVRDAEFVVEAALEDLAVKQALFARLEKLTQRNPVLASNTSVIPITQIMGHLSDRSRALGTHWWNPPFLVPLVEVIGTEWTDPACIDWTMALHAAAGKTPVHVRRDVLGFIGNRLQHALWREAIALVQDGICDAETVDIVVKAGFGRRLAVLGPLENADQVGTDLTLVIHRTVLPHLDRTPDALPYLADLVAAGRLGMKSGEGFRTWTQEQQAELRLRVLNHLKNSR
jgi:3-hydroxybutyryl-CoA dehydrogenase